MKYGFRASFFKDVPHTEWHNLQTFILHCQGQHHVLKENPNKLLSRYRHSLDIIIADDGTPFIEKAAAESLKNTTFKQMSGAYRAILSAQSQGRPLPTISHRPTRIQEPWSSLIIHLNNKVRHEHGRPLVITDDVLKMSKTHLKLFGLVHDRLTNQEPLSILSENEICVALSGIVNARSPNIGKYFGEKSLKNIRSRCFQNDFSHPESIPGLDKFMRKLQTKVGHHVRGAEVDYVGLHQDAILLQAKEIKKSRKKGKAIDPVRDVLLSIIVYLSQAKPSTDMFEAQVVDIWEHVLRLFPKEKLESISSEVPSRATKHQIERLSSDLEIELAKGYGGRLGDLELDNVLIKHSMMLYLEEMIGFQADSNDMLSLDVHGWTATVSCLKKMGDIFICDLATDHALTIPHSAATWRDFLKGETFACLWNYVVSNASRSCYALQSCFDHVLHLMLITCLLWLQLGTSGHYVQES
ncbi:hypothetical protein B0O80DRAFT_170740 [Mortierella sp. GBAus27b]|nr:hypothetical protein B0O80DRAFT_170740 [Mortierella sp. GBAus27b]